MTKNVTEIIDNTPAKTPTRATVVANNESAERALTDAEASRDYGVHWQHATGGGSTNSPETKMAKIGTDEKPRKTSKPEAPEVKPDGKPPKTGISTTSAVEKTSKTLKTEPQGEDAYDPETDAIGPENITRFKELQSKTSRTEAESQEIAGMIRSNKRKIATEEKPKDIQPDTKGRKTVSQGAQPGIAEVSGSDSEGTVDEKKTDKADPTTEQKETDVEERLKGYRGKEHAFEENGQTVKIPKDAAYKREGNETVAEWKSQFDGGPISHKIPDSYKPKTDELDSATLDLIGRAWGPDAKNMKPGTDEPTESIPPVPLTTAEKTPAPTPITEGEPKNSLTGATEKSSGLPDWIGKNSSHPGYQDVLGKFNPSLVKATDEASLDAKSTLYKSINAWAKDSGKVYKMPEGLENFTDTQRTEIETYINGLNKGDRKVSEGEKNTEAPVKRPKETPTNIATGEISSKMDDPTDRTPGKTREDITAANTILDTNMSYRADVVPITVGGVPQAYDRGLGNFWRDMTDSTAGQKVNSDTGGRLHLVDRADALNKNRPGFDPNKGEGFFGDAELFATNVQRKIDTNAFDGNKNNDIFNNADRKIGFGAVPTKLMHQTLGSLTMAKNNGGRYEVRDNTGQPMGEYLKYSDGKSFVKVTSEAFAQSVGVPVGHYVGENGEIHDTEGNLAGVIYRGHARMASNLNN